jgi:Na+-translocating ferredoxin:NAD+ oxidoreductase RNF subunit RnfB
MTDPTSTPPAAPAAQPRRSKTIAKIWEERCTGCEACIAVAPWDNCIIKVSHDPTRPTGMIVCDVQPAVCTGCTLCMKICPWDAISMVPRPTTEPPKPIPADPKY